LGKNRSRNAASFRRGAPKRPPHPRLLIVCEGSKTEPNYFEEIRQSFRIHGAHIRVVPSGYGTQPMQIVEYALDTFKGNPEFEQVYAVFDRDDHTTYHDAIKRAEAHESKLKNRDKEKVRFEAVASVPNFEVWFLMHFQDVTAWIHRDQVLHQLKIHIPAYAKGLLGMFEKTKANLLAANARAATQRRINNRLPGDAIYTDVHKLVEILLSLKPAP